MKIDLTKTIGSLKGFADRAAAEVASLVAVKSGNLKSSIKGVANASEKELEAGVEAEDYIGNQKNKEEIDGKFSQEVKSYIDGEFNKQVVDIINEAVVKTLKKK